MVDVQCLHAAVDIGQCLHGITNQLFIWNFNSFDMYNQNSNIRKIFWDLFNMVECLKFGLSVVPMYDGAMEQKQMFWAVSSLCSLHLPLCPRFHAFIPCFTFCSTIQYIRIEGFLGLASKRVFCLLGELSIGFLTRID